MILYTAGGGSAGCVSDCGSGRYDLEGLVEAIIAGEAFGTGGNVALVRRYHMYSICLMQAPFFLFSPIPGLSAGCGGYLGACYTRSCDGMSAPRLASPKRGGVHTPTSSA